MTGKIAQAEEAVTRTVRGLVCKQKNGEDYSWEVEALDRRVLELAYVYAVFVTKESDTHHPKALRLAQGYRDSEESRMTGGAYTLKDW